MDKAWLIGALAAALATAACSDSNKRSQSAPATTSSGGKPGIIGASGGSETGGSAVSATAGAGGDNTSTAGSNDAGATEGGAAGDAGAASGAPEPNPPVGNPPVCVHGAAFGQVALVALSGAGDDLLQSVTPDELTIAWKNGADYFIAERTDPSAPFGAPKKVVGGSDYLSVALRADGRKLVAITAGLQAVEMLRLEGEAFDAASAVTGDFDDFDHTLNGSPEPGKVFTDAVLSADDNSFFYSYFLMGDGSGAPTLRESRRDSGFWSFTSLKLGSLLTGSADKRRIPTGVASDNLTLFYRDEVEGEFRAAWRVNTQVEFDHAETLGLGQNVRAVAPNQACSKLYFTAQGATDLDLFVSTKQ